jgi:hypothetical protein
MHEQNPLENLIRLSSRPESYSWCTCSANICKLLGGRVAWQLPAKQEASSSKHVQAEKKDETHAHVTREAHMDKVTDTRAVAQTWTRGDGGYGIGSSWREASMSFMGGLGTGIKMLMVG